MVKKQSKEAIRQTLSAIPCVPSHRPTVDLLISQAATEISRQLNPGIGLGSYYAGDNLKFVMFWKGNENLRPLCNAKLIVINCWEYPVRWKRYPKKISLPDIKAFLDSLSQEVKAYKGQRNPATRLCRMVDRTGYLVATAGASVLELVPEKWRIILPVGLDISEAINYALTNFQNPTKRAAVYRYLAQRVRAADAPVIAAYKDSEKDDVAKAVLSDLIASKVAVTESKSQPRRL